RSPPDLHSFPTRRSSDLPNPWVLRKPVCHRTDVVAPPGEEEPMKQRVWLFGALVCGLLGCAHPQTRLQAEDEGDRDKQAEVKTIDRKSTRLNSSHDQISY